MTIDFRERERPDEPPELFGLVLLIGLIATLTLVCWLSL
jgi:hypothetical protein